MPEHTINISLRGALEHFEKSKRPLAPIYELIVNSIEAIIQSPREKIQAPEVILKFNFSGLLGDVQKIQSVEVVDNGIGFNDENFQRFKTLLDKSKNFNNRGSGRLQFLQRFQQIRVESTFKTNDQFYLRTFKCNPLQFVYNEVCEPTKTTKIGSSVTLLEPDMHKNEHKFYDNLTLDYVKQDLRNYLALLLYLDSKTDYPISPKLVIEFYKNDQLTGSDKIQSSDIPEPVSEDTLSLFYMVPTKDQSGKISWEKMKEKTETINWAHFRLPEDELEMNSIWLCSKNVTVEPIKFNKINKKQSVEGHRYLTVFYGDILNDEKNVSHEVDSFKFPYKKDIEAKIQDDLFNDEGVELIVKDEIEDAIQHSLPNIYSDLMEAQKEVEKDVAVIANAHAIPQDIAESIDAKISDTEQQITHKLYKKQAEQMASRNFEIKKIYEELVSLDPTDDNYQEELLDRSNELLSKIPQQNKEELSRYIIRREMVAKILSMILNNSLDYQTKKRKPAERNEKEGLIHDLIIKRKNSSHTDLNDLWILNEEFVHFESCSELGINQIKLADGRFLLKKISTDEIKKYGLSPGRRPDIFLFPEEGKCILVELKATDVDLSDHLQQMVKYCNLIANYAAVPTNRFYCYLIGEKLSEIDLPTEYVETVNGDWVKPETSIRSIFPDDGRKIIGNIYSEIILLSSVLARAQRRNRSFAERLGVRVD